MDNIGSVNSLVIMVTSACQLKCSYCEVKQSSDFISKRLLEKAIDLLMTTQDKSCQVRYWGGEPFLRWDLIQSGMVYGDKVARQFEKKIKYMITTNGFLLNRNKIDFLRNYPVEIMFSLDGDIYPNELHRKYPKTRGYSYEILLNNLRQLQDSKIPYFVNLVVSPVTVTNLAQNLFFLKKEGVTRIQLCYQCGIIWPVEKKQLFFSDLKDFIKDDFNFAGSFLMNFYNNCEPTMLSQEVLVYTDGGVYLDAAIFMEKKFPRLKKSFFLGDIHDINAVDSLFRSKKEIFHNYQKSCSAMQEKVFLNNVNFGIELEAFLAGLHQEPLDSNEHPDLTPLIKGTFHMQADKLLHLGINAAFLHIETPCLNNCLFCRQKKINDFEDLFKIELKLRQNLELEFKKLCIIGNEPLAHPDIIDIIKLAKKYKFCDIEILTSGELLSEDSFLDKILSSGGNSFSIPIFSLRSDTHNYIVGNKNSHQQLMTVIKNLQKHKVKAFYHSNLIKQNLNDIIDLEFFMTKKMNLPFAILPIRPKMSNVPYQQIAVTFDEMKKTLKGINSLLGFPLCVTAKIQKDLFLPSNVISDSMKLYVLDQKFIKINKCARCNLSKKCLGFFEKSLNAANAKYIKSF